MYGNKSEILISVCMLSNSRMELIFVSSPVAMNRIVFAKYVSKSNRDNKMPNSYLNIWSSIL